MYNFTTQFHFCKKETLREVDSIKRIVLNFSFDKLTTKNQRLSLLCC